MCVCAHVSACVKETGVFVRERDRQNDRETERARGREGMQRAKSRVLWSFSALGSAFK